MQFFITGIKDSNRGVFTVNDFNPEDIVRSLKLVITNKFGLPYDIFYLTCGTKTLSDEKKSLKYYGVESESSVEIRFRFSNKNVVIQ